MLYFYLYQICYKILGGFTKLTFCFLYLKAFVFKNPDTLYQRHFKNIVICTAAVIGVGTFAFTVATIFQCTPVKRAWDRRVPGYCTDNLVSMLRGGETAGMLPELSISSLGLSGIQRTALLAGRFLATSKTLL